MSVKILHLITIKHLFRIIIVLVQLIISSLRYDKEYVRLLKYVRLKIDALVIY